MGPMRLWGEDLEGGRETAGAASACSSRGSYSLDHGHRHPHSSGSAQPFGSLFRGTQAGHYVSEDGLELLTLLPLPPKC